MNLTGVKVWGLKSKLLDSLSASLYIWTGPHGLIVSPWEYVSASIPKYGWIAYSYTLLVFLALFHKLMVWIIVPTKIIMVKEDNGKWKEVQWLILTLLRVKFASGTNHIIRKMWSFMFSWYNKLTRIWSYLPAKDRFTEGLCSSCCCCHWYSSNKSIMGGCKSGVLTGAWYFYFRHTNELIFKNFIALIKSHASGYCNGVIVWSRIYGHHIWRVSCIQQKWSRTSDGREFMGRSKHWGKAWVYVSLL